MAAMIGGSGVTGQSYKSKERIPSGEMCQQKNNLSIYGKKENKRKKKKKKKTERKKQHDSTNFGFRLRVSKNFDFSLSISKRVQLEVLECQQKLHPGNWATSSIEFFFKTSDALKGHTVQCPANWTKRPHAPVKTPLLSFITKPQMHKRPCGPVETPDMSSLLD